jgi:ectoine hydroxylase-related dioxygenase (phytanoyl-CoA dioxygenase family)
VRAPHPDEIHLTGRKGTVVIFNGHCWHGGTMNVDGARRRVLHVSYVGRDRDQQLDCRHVTTPETRQRLAPEVRYLLDI